jgi:hemolysin activation/secretion protein
MKAIKFLVFILSAIGFLNINTIAFCQQNASSDIDILDRERNVPPAPRSQPRPRISEDEQGEVKFDSNIYFILKDISIDGLTAFSETELLEPYKNLYGTLITFNDLLNITKEITLKYRENNYLLSRVILPPQEVDVDGASIRLISIEGYLSDIIFDGEEGDIKKISIYLQNEIIKLKNLRPLDFSKVESLIMRINDIPGIEATTTLDKGKDNNTSILIINVIRRIINLNFGLNNIGTESAGPWMINTNLGISSIPSIGNNFILSYSQAFNFKEYYNIGISDYYFFANGLSIGMSYSFSESQKPDSEFARLFDQATKSHTYNISVDYPIIRSRNINLSTNIVYSHRNSEVKLLNTPYTHDKLRSLSYGLNFDYSDNFGGVTQIIPTFTHGINLFNASNLDSDSSSPLAPAQYSKFELYISRNQNIISTLNLIFTANLQLAGTILPSYEQFSLGGQQFGKGYDPGALEGDNGFGYGLEANYTILLTKTLVLQPYIFFDGGFVWTKGYIEGIDPHEDLSSMGLGFRFWIQPHENLLKSSTLNFFIGKPLKNINDKSNERFILTINFNF